MVTLFDEFTQILVVSAERYNGPAEDFLSSPFMHPGGASLAAIEDSLNQGAYKKHCSFMKPNDVTRMVRGIDFVTDGLQAIGANRLREIDVLLFDLRTFGTPGELEAHPFAQWLDDMKYVMIRANTGFVGIYADPPAGVDHVVRKILGPTPISPRVCTTEPELVYELNRIIDQSFLVYGRLRRPPPE